MDVSLSVHSTFKFRSGKKKNSGLGLPWDCGAAISDPLSKDAYWTLVMCSMPLFACVDLSSLTASERVSEPGVCVSVCACVLAARLPAYGGRHPTHHGTGDSHSEAPEIDQAGCYPC